jgi:hypothetical protein
VTENYIRDFDGRWTGTAEIVNPGSDDTEKVVMEVGEDLESETWNLGSGQAQITLDKYGTGSGPTPTIEYKTGSTKAICEGQGWTEYTGAFTSDGWVKIRLSR